MTPDDRRRHIGEFFRLLSSPDAVVEVRAPKAGRYRKTASGYFDNETDFVNAVMGLSGTASGIYATLNPVTPSLLARAANRINSEAELTTDDKQITRRRWILLDFDPVRPSGISSTDEEHEAALSRAQCCAEWLKEECGIDPVRLDSGNGAHLLVPVDLPNDESSKELIKHILEAVAYRYDDDVVTVDCSVFNSARITKIPGTKTGKGDNTPDRPHRYAKILSRPNQNPPVPMETLLRIAALAPEPEKPFFQRSNSGSTDPVTFVRDFLAQHDIKTHREMPYKGGFKWQLQVCPFDPNHIDGDAAVFAHPGGSGFKCLHNSCAGRRWHDFREFFEPGYSERPALSRDRNSADGTQSGKEVLPQNPFSVGAIRADQLPDAVPPVRIWFGLYPRSVALLIGETGAGKSSLLYNIAIRAALNKMLWGVEFGLGRPLRVLYIDPENSGNFNEGQGGQCAVKIERIDAGKPRDLVFHTGQGVNLSNLEHMEALRRFIVEGEFDIVILDPIANLFHTKDENDNAEAARQMTALTALSRATGACIIPVHHTGKDSQGNYGRGASARLAAADVAFVFRSNAYGGEQDDNYTGELQERNDICRLQIVKNRLEGRASLYLQMDGQDSFARCTFEDWKGGAKKDDSKVSQAKERILAYLDEEEWYTRDTILRVMSQAKIGRNAVDDALDELTKEGKIQSEKRGRGGALQFCLAVSEEEIDTSGTFPVSLFSIENRETGKVQGEGDREEGEIA